MTDIDTIRFYTRQGCPLCEDALVLVREFATEVGSPVEVIDIDLDLALLDAYNERVPVVEYRGEVIAEGIVTGADLIP